MLISFFAGFKAQAKESCIDPMQIGIEMSTKVLDSLVIIPTSETRSKGTPHVKRVIDSVRLSTSCQDQIDKHHALGNDTSTGLTSEGKNKWGLFWACFCKCWLSDDKFISIWSIHCADRFDNYCGTHDRANNGLERKVII